jgi:hypothetical protein
MEHPACRESGLILFCTVCRWGSFASWPAPFTDELLGILPVSRAGVLFPREWSIYPEPLLLHLRMSSHFQMAPAQHATESRAAKDAVKGGNPAAVINKDQSVQSTTENHLY